MKEQERYANRNQFRHCPGSTKLNLINTLRAGMPEDVLRSLQTYRQTPEEGSKSPPEYSVVAVMPNKYHDPCPNSLLKSGYGPLGKECCLSVIDDLDRQVRSP